MPRVKVEGVRDEQWLCQGTAPKGGAEELIAGGQLIGGQVAAFPTLACLFRLIHVGLNDSFSGLLHFQSASSTNSDFQAHHTL